MPENSKIDFYNREYNFNRAFSKIDEWCKYTRNKELIDRLLKWAKAKDLSYARRERYLFFLKYVVNWLSKPLDEVTRDDIIDIVGKINNSPFSYETKRMFKQVLKKFYDVTCYDSKKELVDWLYDRRNDVFKNNHEQDGIRNEKVKISKEELSQMIAVADIRMKAYLSVAFESCCRPSELLACTISDLEPTNDGFKLKIPQSKTKIRTILLFESARYISDWVRIHPNKKPNSFLFCTNSINNKGGRWSPVGAIKQLKYIAKIAGVNKNINNYILRRSGFTHKSVIKRISNSSMELLMGWSKGAFERRCKDYDLTKEDDMENELRQVYGRSPKKELQDIKAQVCFKCGFREENPIAEKYCRRCSAPLDPEIIGKIEVVNQMNEKLWEKLVECIDIKKLKNNNDALEIVKELKLLHK